MLVGSKWVVIHSLNPKPIQVVQIFFQDISLTPAVALVLFVIACLSGYGYRRVWKAEGPRWQLWVYGLVAAGTLLTLGFVPMAVPG